MRGLRDAAPWGESLSKEKGTEFGPFMDVIRCLCFGVIAVLLVIGAPLPLAAQSAARISGSVRDQSGAVIPDASVVLRDQDSGTEIRGVTDSSGFYSIDPVPPKTYTLTVRMKGFKTYAQTGLVVHPADRLDISVILQLGQQVETIEVSAQAVNLVTTDSGAKTDVIAANEIENLSTIGRSAVELISLLPGVVNSGFNPLSGTTFGLGPDAFNVNGLRSDMNDVRMDSAHMIDPGCNCGNIIEPNMDMIQEFSVKTSNFEADQGRSAMIMDTVVKSGGSRLHGEGYWYTRNAFFNANDWSNNLAGIPRPASKFNYPGFNIGGPVKLPHSDFNKNNDKLFFFVAMEWQRQLPDPGTELATVPTAKMRTGDFTDLLSMKDTKGNLFCTPVYVKDLNGNPVLDHYDGRALNMPCQLQDPNSWGTPIVSNILSPSDITQRGTIFLNVFPLPNYVDPNGVFNFAGRPLLPNNRNEQVVRLDSNLSDNTRLYIRLGRNADHQLYPYGLWSGENSGWTSNIPEPSPTIGINSGEALSINVVRIVNPTLTNEFQFHTQALWLPNHFTDPRKLSKTALGFNFKGMTFQAPNVPGFENGKVYTGDFIPQITDGWSYSSSGLGPGGNPGAGRWGEGDVGRGIFADKTEFQWIDNLTKVHGTHTIKFGGDIDRTRNDQNGGPVPEGMLITQNWGGMGTNNEFGDIITEHFKGMQQGLPNNDGLWRFWNVEWYAQDSWKAKRRLTLNYGIRFSWMQPWNEARSLAGTFEPQVYDPTQAFITVNGSRQGNFMDGIVTARSGKVPSSVFPNSHPVPQPRVGFAYDVFGTGKTVLRGGFGTFVQRDQGNIAFFMSNSVPFSFSSTYSPCCFQTLANIEAANPFGSLGNLGFQAVDPTDRGQPQTYEWSFTLAQNIGLKTVVEASYVGNASRHLYVQKNLNALAPGTMWNPGTDLCCQVTGLADNAAQGDTTTAHYALYKPWGNINWTTHSSSANYNSLQVTARRNVSQGLTILASYTWSKTLGYSTSFQSTVDPFDSHRNYGFLPWDRSHLLNFSYIYQLPNAGQRYFGANRLARGTLDGWRVSGITHYASGAPLGVNISSISCQVVDASGNPLSFPNGTPTQCADPNGALQFSGGNVSWYGTGDIALRPIITWQDSGVRKVGSNWVNANSITLPGMDQFGTFETPIFRGPGSYNWDLTLFKSFSLGESRRLELRIAAFDFINHANFASPNQNATFNWNVPVSTPCHSPLQPGDLCYRGGYPVLTNNFGQIFDATGHRELELALKLYF